MKTRAPYPIATVLPPALARAFADRAPIDRQAREQARAAVEAYRGPIKRLPTYAALRCRSCGHRGTAIVPDGVTNPRFTCSRCGSPRIAWQV